MLPSNELYLLLEYHCKCVLFHASLVDPALNPIVPSTKIQFALISYTAALNLHQSTVSTSSIRINFSLTVLYVLDFTCSHVGIVLIFFIYGPYCRAYIHVYF